MEEEEEEEDKTSGLEAHGEEVTESTSLLGSTTMSRERRFRRRRGSFSGQGTASFTQAILMVRNINEVQESELKFCSVAQVFYWYRRLIPWESVESLYFFFFFPIC